MKNLMTDDELPMEVRYAKAFMFGNQPFWATLLCSLCTVWYNPDAKAPADIASVNGKGQIVFGPKGVKMARDEIVFVLAHEILHVVYHHLHRGNNYAKSGYGPDLKPFDMKAWAMATDYVINAFLVENGVGRMPRVGLLDARFKGDDLVEDVYLQLVQDDSEQGDGEQGDGEQGDGEQGDSDSGPGNDPASGGMDAHDTEGCDEVDEDSAAANVEMALTQALAAAENAKQGKVPAELRNLVEKVLEPKVSWRGVLQEEICNKIKGEIPCWSRPHKPSLVFSEITGISLPIKPSGVGVTVGTIAVQVDTSGSCVSAAPVFLAEISNLVNQYKPDELIIMWVDAAVAHVDRICEQYASAMDDILRRMREEGVPGGGGTDMCEGFRWLQNAGVVPDTMVTLTDGYTPWPDNCTWSHVTITTARDSCPFGRTVSYQE